MIGRGLLQAPTAWQAIGYAQIGEYLAGKTTREAMLESIVVATRQYARRQASWFRGKHPDAVFLTVPAES